MAKKSSSSRRERRKNYSKAGFLKIKNDYNPLGEVLKGWYKKTSEEGKLAHEAHTRMVQEQIEEALQAALNKSKENWSESSNSLTWFKAKGKIDLLFKQLKIITDWKLSSDLNYKTLLHPYRTGQLYLSDGTSLGIFGQIHPILATKMNLASELYLFEFNFDLIKDELKKNKITIKTIYNNKNPL